MVATVSTSGPPSSQYTMAFIGVPGANVPGSSQALLDRQ